MVCGVPDEVDGSSVQLMPPSVDLKIPSPRYSEPHRVALDVEPRISPEPTYQVRAFDVAKGRLIDRVIADKSDAGDPMQGYPLTRASASGGAWAYTLYGRDHAKAFVHALMVEAVASAGERKMRTNLKDLAYVAELLESGDVVPVIDRRYSLNQVPEAIRYIEEGHARGKVVITI